MAGPDKIVTQQSNLNKNKNILNGQLFFKKSSFEKSPYNQGIREHQRRFKKSSRHENALHSTRTSYRLNLNRRG